MAIYTSYGRYQKAKLFKEMLEQQGDTYMLLGLGNPFWDKDDANQPIPVAPYDTTHIRYPDNASTNQFYDDHINQYFDGSNQTVSDGLPVGAHINACKDLIPPFPCIWQHYTGNNKTVIEGPGITQDDYQNYYIDSSGYLHIYGDPSSTQIDWPTDQYERQFYAELYLRGIAQDAGYSHPAGLLGAIRCSIAFVKDIGTELDENYNGSVDQFWYGDRYWEIVDPNETTLDSYITGDTKIYPHHLLFSATINPRQLCATNLNVDQNLVPRQIALFSKALTPTTSGDDVIYAHGPNAYRVGDYIFNFGQYSSDDLAQVSAEVLNFTFPCTVDDVTYPAGDFKFILSDYIKGAIRNKHSVDRIGYIVGF